MKLSHVLALVVVALLVAATPAMAQSPGGAESRPYAIDVTADGAVWYVETGDDAKNVLVRFNPETKKFQTFPIPAGGGTVRNMDIDKSGNLWLAESGVGKIARVTIRRAASTQ